MSTSGLSTVLTNVNNAFSGKTSGIDVSATVTALMQVQRQPEVLMQQQQSDVKTRISALGTIASDLSQLQTVVAVAIGYFLGGEAIGPRTIVGTTLVLIGVILIATSRKRTARGAADEVESGKSKQAA